jgi:hypothetical protein
MPETSSSSYKSKTIVVTLYDGSKRYKSPDGNIYNEDPRKLLPPPVSSEPAVIQFDVDEAASTDETSFLVQVRNGIGSDWQTVHNRNTMSSILNAYNESRKSKDNKRIVVKRTEIQPVLNYSPRDERKRQQALKKLTEEERQALGI